MRDLTNVLGTSVSLTFTAENGLSPYSVLEAAWILPGLIQGIRTEVWKGSTEHPIYRLWVSLGLIQEETGVLTMAGLNIVQTKDLFEYEFSMIQQQLDNNFITDPKKYSKLRGALADFSDTYLTDLTNWLIDQTPEAPVVLDFAGGSGYYLAQILKARPAGHGWLYDKAAEPGLLDELGVSDRVNVEKSDFYNDFNFFSEYAGTFSTIIVSEILHCVPMNEWDKLLQMLESLLAPQGKLIVIEQHHNFRLDWRLQALSKGQSVPVDFMNQRLSNFCLREGSTTMVGGQKVLSTHYAVTIRRVK